MADPDAPAQKRPRLDSVNPPAYNNGHAFPPPPPPPPHPQNTRQLTHSAPAHAVPSPTSRHYPAHGLPHPPHSYPPPGQGPQPGPQPSPSLPPSDIRAYSDPRTIPSPSQRPHGVGGPPPVNISQDNISTYRAPPTPQSATVPEPQSNRSSISTEVKPQPPPMDHGGHQSPWGMTPEHRQNGHMSNGYSHSISPTHHSNGQPFHPPPPPPTTQYDQGAYAPSPYMGQYAGSSGQPVRRKQVRATQACNHCRTRKQKCDEARPCQFCRENNFDCQYKDVPPPKQDRSMMQLQDSVNDIGEVLKNLVGEFASWRQSVETRLPHAQSSNQIMNIASPEAGFVAPSRDQNGSRFPTPAQGRSQMRRISNMKAESPSMPHGQMSPTAGQALTPIKQESMFAPPQQPATPADSVRSEHSGATGLPLKEKSGLQSDHTTPAHKLFEEWQSMAPFCRGVDYIEKLLEGGHEVSEYPMLLEQDRGLLRVWGVGEGQDLNDGAQGPGSPESSGDADASSPAPGKEGLWGYPPADTASPGTVLGEAPRSDPRQDRQENNGGLGPDGRPDFREKVLWELYDSYIENIHKLHPFMNASKLRRMIKEFSEQYSPDVNSKYTGSPAANTLAHHQGIKRKRSSSAYGEPYSAKGAIERSLRNALVLLVLALGKVCAYHDPLPSPQSDKMHHTNGGWGVHANGSFNSDTSDDNRPRNVDILPGMGYFAYATDILGNQQGGNTVAHAQAMILAALYLSQFARVLESWSWINNACRVVLVLIKADYQKLDRNWCLDNKASLPPKERYRLNLVMCVYWTCLQLESDILAEMSTLPPSRISDFQSEIAYPDGVYESVPIESGTSVEDKLFADPKTQEGSMLMYSSQIWLRVILNEAHNMLYGRNARRSFDTHNIKEVAHRATAHVRILEDWRRVLPPALAWNDDDPPATDINVARLRAKYYGSIYVILRPYLRIANHFIDFPPTGAARASHHNSPAPNHGSSSDRNVHLLVDLSDDQRSIIGVAVKCINAAIQSTIAFDRVGAAPDSKYVKFDASARTRRLVVTNIFGTMHAQFGNMLVLCAVFKSQLCRYLPKDTQLTKQNLTLLLDRTRKVIGEIAPNSPILEMDLKILRNVRKQLDLYL
ncbi:hypothetical protein B5807_11072 [Epicoccum nigrum]|uniref:Zn(2)-C6 fungal-type domain-containing protein n=1 Tax=Epicoccum nigrum TaxID=105696 RepID=A0A1Y2LN62_EPING|nr:hypothetical protein B5807_11072 [Epicoccum nigrum]